MPPCFRKMHSLNFSRRVIKGIWATLYADSWVCWFNTLCCWMWKCNVTNFSKEYCLASPSSVTGTAYLTLYSWPWAFFPVWISRHCHMFHAFLILMVAPSLILTVKMCINFLGNGLYFACIFKVPRMYRKGQRGNVVEYRPTRDSGWYFQRPLQRHGQCKTRLSSLSHWLIITKVLF